MWKYFMILMTSLQLAGASNTAAVKGVIKRLVGYNVNRFEFKIEPKSEDYFTVDSSNNKILLRGNNSISLCSGFNYYLKHVANGQISWNGDHVPAKFPLPKQKITKKSPYKWRHYYNYCTLSYTMAFKDWKAWEREIDLMAIRGTNLALILPGHEKVWQNTLKRLGYSDKDISAFIPTSAHTAWWLMANMENPGKAVPQDVIENEAKLGRKICDRMRELGIEPAINGFFGMVPTTFKNYYPNAKIIPQGNWGAGPRPSVLSPLDPMFQKCAEIWYEEAQKVFGKVNFYGGDLFHEGGHTGGLPLAECSVAVQKNMIKHNPDAVWYMQSWQVNPRPEMIKACDPKHVLVQQLAYAAHDWEKRGYWGKLRTFDGADWTLSYILNFGGGEGMHGNLMQTMRTPDFLLSRSDLKECRGIGMLCEGTRTNPVNYDLISDLVWMSKSTDINEWLKDYAQRRYGKADKNIDKAWRILNKTVYAVNANQEGQTDSILSAIPSKTIIKARLYGRGNIWYDSEKLVPALNYFLKAAKSLKQRETYRHDLVDLSRQLIQDYARLLHPEIIAAYEAGDKKEFNSLSQRFLQMMNDCDQILACDERFLLGPWLRDARAKAQRAEGKNIMELSARYLITQWSSRSGRALSDYSNRQWAGLMKDYYKPRWKLFFKSLADSLEQPQKASEIEKNYFNSLPRVEKSWIEKVDSGYATQPRGDAVKIATHILKKYGPLMKESVSKKPKRLAEMAKWNYDLSKSTEKIQTLEWEVYSEIQTQGAGTYQVKFLWQKGNNALEIEAVELVQGDKVLAVDKHSGWTGWEHRDNIYTLQLKNMPATVASYKIRARVKGAGGNNSQGRIFFSKAK